MDSRVFCKITFCYLCILIVYTVCMKKFLTIFFVVLGVIFFLILVSFTAFIIIDPLNLRAVFFSNNSVSIEKMQDTGMDTEDANTALSSEQEEALRSAGIDPQSVPSSFTPEQEQCVIELFGEARVNEIKSGATPTSLETLSALKCL